MEKIKVVLLKAEAATPEVMEVEKDENGSCWKGLSALVGGWLECVSPECYGVEGVLKNYDLWIDDEGLLKELPANIALNEDELLKKNFSFAGLLFGPVVVAGYNETGETMSVKDEDIKPIFQQLESLMLVNKGRLLKAFE